MQLFCPPQILERVRPWVGELQAVGCVTRPQNAEGYYLWWRDDRLVLYRGGDDHGVCIEPAELQRRATLRGELARACGVTAKRKPRILDAMAGLGVDGMTLAALGCQVVMIERHTALWAMLESYVQVTARKDTSGPEVIHADAWAWLQARSCDDDGFDVIYLDPMFPARRKGALPGKVLQFLAELAPVDGRDLRDWIELAVQHARSRVVLKRRLRDPAADVPDWQVKGRSVRYDVYRAG